MKRRKFIGASAAASVGLLATTTTGAMPTAKRNTKKELKGNIQHSACRWCYSKIPMEEFLKNLNDLGIKAMDLTGPEDWPLMKKYNIHASMCWGAGLGIEKGWNNPELHEELIADYLRVIPLVAEAGYKNLICFSGNRNGMNDLVGLENCVTGIQQILPTAKEHGVVIQMELFNQVNHPDYMCDTSAWGIELCKGLGSESFKLLYDIYHMQIQEGDIIRSIQNNHQYFGHYHTAGVPGRHEIDETQELYYPAIMRAILATGYTGYVAQEFIPEREDKIESLKQGFLICDV